MVMTEQRSTQMMGSTVFPEKLVGFWEAYRDYRQSIGMRTSPPQQLPSCLLLLLVLQKGCFFVRVHCEALPCDVRRCASWGGLKS